MITREHLDERQGRLLNLLTALFEQQPFLDTTSAVGQGNLGRALGHYWQRTGFGK